MCDKCDSAATELQAFVDDLLKKYPATEVDGQTVPVNHHVLVALLSEMAAQKLVYTIEEQVLQAPTSGLVN